MPKFTISAADLPVLRNGEKYFLQFKLVSSDRNVSSAWSVIYELEQPPVT